MKAQPVKLVEGEYCNCESTEATHIRLKMPGPIPGRLIPIMLNGGG
jgi:hypothetical protein